MIDMSSFTWSCHICNKIRPDPKIDVYSTKIDFGNGVIAQQNVRYCNDSLDCTEKAKSFNFRKQKEI